MRRWRTQRVNRNRVPSGWIFQVLWGRPEFVVNSKVGCPSGPPATVSDSCGFSVPIGSLNRLLLWGMFLATLPHSLLRYGCEIFATLRIFLNRVTIQDRFSAEVLSKQ